MKEFEYLKEMFPLEPEHPYNDEPPKEGDKVYVCRKFKATSTSREGAVESLEMHISDLIKNKKIYKIRLYPNLTKTKSSYGDGIEDIYIIWFRWFEEVTGEDLTKFLQETEGM